jgi:hypothetical protein
MTRQNPPTEGGIETEPGRTGRTFRRAQRSLVARFTFRVSRGFLGTLRAFEEFINSGRKSPAGDARVPEAIHDASDGGCILLALVPEASDLVHQVEDSDREIGNLHTRAFDLIEQPPEVSL